MCKFDASLAYIVISRPRIYSETLGEKMAPSMANTELGDVPEVAEHQAPTLVGCMGKYNRERGWGLLCLPGFVERGSQQRRGRGPGQDTLRLVAGSESGSFFRRVQMTHGFGLPGWEPASEPGTRRAGVRAPGRPAGPGWGCTGAGWEPAPSPRRNSPR